MKTKMQIMAMVRVLWHEFIDIRPADFVLGVLGLGLCIEAVSMLFGVVFIFFGVN